MAEEIHETFNYEETHDWSSEDLNIKAMELANLYPEIVSYKLLGYSYDKKPIYVLVVGNETEDKVYDHYLIEGGTHAREIANSAILLKMVEDYALDFYDDNFIEEYSVHELLDTTVFHFYILTNPDGFDLVKFGQESIKTNQAREIFKGVNNEEQSKHKANIRGVDLNYNFETIVYNVSRDEWVDESILGYKKAYATEPTNYFYPGEYPGSEIETQLLQGYVNTEDFRMLISYHSTGSVVYWGNTWLSSSINADAEYVATTIADYTGYKLMDFTTSTVTGFFSDYFESATLKPGITIETYQVVQPTPKNQYTVAEYDKVMSVPLYMAGEYRNIGVDGYYDYKMYINGEYSMDFKEIEYATAYAKKNNGYILKYQGKPKKYVTEIFDDGTESEANAKFKETLVAINNMYNEIFSGLY